ncbi:MAG: cytochrome c oxidase subunit 3 [Acidobacteriota bacterium]
MSAGHAAANSYEAGLAHHFESFEQQKESSFLGMWLFLVQEIMFFGGLFVAYAVYRSMYPAAFMAGSQQLDTFWGFLNTLVLLCSSFTMVLAVWGAQVGRKKVIVWGLIGTIFFGAVFLGVKVVEYSAKFEHHLVPGESFEWPPKKHHGGDHGAEAAAHGADDLAHGAVIATEAHGADVAIDSSNAVEMSGRGGAIIFFFLYFFMTGMHALHMVIGIVIMLIMLPMAAKGKWGPDNHNFVEGFGLYWHFVDLVWIFLFPFLYLLGAH